MNCLKKTTCTLLALWTPIVFAYSRFANSEGEVLSPPTQMEIGAAVLLDENGEARCKIVSSEFLLSERFNEFVEQNPEAEEVLDELNGLRECDDGDELYADIVLNPEEIKLGAFDPSAHLVVIALGLSYAAEKVCPVVIYPYKRVSDYLVLRIPQNFLNSGLNTSIVYALYKVITKAAGWSVASPFFWGGMAGTVCAELEHQQSKIEVESVSTNSEEKAVIALDSYKGVIRKAFVVGGNIVTPPSWGGAANMWYVLNLDTDEVKIETESVSKNQ